MAAAVTGSIPAPLGAVAPPTESAATLPAVPPATKMTAEAEMIELGATMKQKATTATVAETGAIFMERVIGIGVRAMGIVAAVRRSQMQSKKIYPNASKKSVVGAGVRAMGIIAAVRRSQMQPRRMV